MFTGDTKHVVRHLPPSSDQWKQNNLKLMCNMLSRVKYIGAERANLTGDLSGDTFQYQLSVLSPEHATLSTVCPSNGEFVPKTCDSGPIKIDCRKCQAAEKD
jgi:hypothetical protein